MNEGRASHRRLRNCLQGAAVVLAAASLAACSGGQSIGGGSATASNSSPYGFTTAKQNASAPITVWVDSTRLAAAPAATKAPMRHPDTAASQAQKL